MHVSSLPLVVSDSCRPLEAMHVSLLPLVVTR